MILLSKLYRLSVEEVIRILTQTNTNPSSTDRVYEKLKKDIIESVYEPGQIITESQIAHNFGVSRTPVREAVNRLQNEKLLITIPKVGIQVSMISLTEIKETFEIRKALEALAIKLAIQNKCENDDMDLKQLLNQYIENIDNEFKSAELDVKIHQKIWRMSKNASLISYLVQIEESEHRLWHNAIKKNKDLTFCEPNTEDNRLKKLVNCVIKEDVDGAITAVNDHLDYYLAQLRNAIWA